MVSLRPTEVAWARRLPGRPAGIPIGRPRGAKAAGLRYERALGAALGPGAAHGVWWEYASGGARRFCQTDFVILGAYEALILESKYTWRPDAWDQLELYKAVLARALGLRPLGVQVCKVLLPAAASVTGDLAEALALARAGGQPVLHWLGVGPLLRPCAPVARAA